MDRAKSREDWEDLMNTIPYGRQDISQADIDAVIDVLRSDYLTQGPIVPAFESAVATYCKARYAVAVNSATSALHLACMALGVGRGDIVWTSPITFVASANCALYCGASVDFVDIDPRTYNLSVERLEEKLINAQKTGTLPKVIIPVHLCGQSCEMAAIHKLSRQYGFKIIEDASHAIGGKYKNEPIGCGHFSDITVFSFHPVKIITTAEGGMALTNSEELARKMVILRSHGITRDEDHMTHKSHGPWYYQQIDLGYNYRMTELQAALGLSQMNRLDAFVARRHKLVNFYNQKLVELPLTLPWQCPDSYSSFHLYVIRLQVKNNKKIHSHVLKSLRELGIGVNVHYIPVHTQPYYERLGFMRGDFPQSELYYEEAISLPMFQTLAEEQQHYVVYALTKVLV